MNEQEKFEAKRIKSLKEYEVLDTLPEKEFDELVELAAEVYGVPVSYISLMDSERQWFKSMIGLSINEAQRNHSFCNYTIMNPDKVNVVKDATKDERYKDNPYVTQEPHIQFYAGISLKSKDNLPIGTLCVVDYKPRKFDEAQERLLRGIAQRIMNLLEMRKNNLIQEKELGKTKQKLHLTFSRLIEAQEIARIGSWDWDVKNNNLDWSDMMYEIFNIGRDIDKKNLFKAWKEKVFEEDAERILDIVKSTLKNKMDIDFIYKAKVRGSILWIETKGKIIADHNGEVAHISGTAQDITSRKATEMEREVYASTLHDMLFDLSHKVRRPISNCLGLVDAINYETLPLEKVYEFAKYLKSSVKEIDEYIRQLSEYVYENQKVISNVKYKKEES